MSDEFVEGELVENSNLRDRSMQGGAILAVRQGVGMVIRVVGVILLTRLLGPAVFGWYAGSLAIVNVLSVFGYIGVDTYLVRHPGQLSRALADVSFTIVLTLSVVITALSVAATVVYGRIFGDAPYLPILITMLCVLPVKITFAPFQAILERDMRYRTLAIMELGADLSHYGLAITLAFAGAGAWAPVVGFCAWQLWLLVSGFIATRYKPRLSINRDLARPIFRFARSNVPASALGLARETAPLLLLGPTLGASAVGFASLAERLCDSLSFGKRVIKRISTVAIASIQEDRRRVASAIREGLRLQPFVVGPFLLAFGYLGPLIVPLLLSDRWQELTTVYAFVAVSHLLIASFMTHRMTLVVMNRQGLVLLFELVQLVLLLAVAGVLVPHIGLRGYGIGAMASGLSSLVLIKGIDNEFAIARRHYRLVGAMVVAVVGPATGPRYMMFFLIPLVLVIWPMRQQLIKDALRIGVDRLPAKLRLPFQRRSGSNDKAIDGSSGCLSEVRPGAAVEQSQPHSACADILSARYQSFPPGRGNVWVPTSYRGASVRAIEMYAPVLIRGETMQILAKSSVMLTKRILTAGKPRAHLPLDPVELDQIVELSRPIIGTFDSLGLYGRIASERAGVSLLLIREGRSLGMLRWKPDLAASEREVAALSALSSRNPSSFVVPQLLGHNLHPDMPWSMIEPLPCGHRRPVTQLPSRDAMDDLAECLAGGMLGHGEPHWRASHGDFSPWNLRRHGRRMFLFDWEDARWAPAGTDELFFRLTLANARNRSFVARDGEEAAAHFVRVQLQARLALDPHNVSLLRLNRTIVRHDPM